MFLVKFYFVISRQLQNQWFPEDELKSFPFEIINGDKIN